MDDIKRNPYAFLLEKDTRDKLKKLSIVIVNYNTQQLLKICLKSIYDSARDLCFEVFVVDNASSDGSLEMVKTHFPQVQLIVNHNDVGFTKAANLALATGKGDYFLVSHPDIEFTTGCIQNMLNFLTYHDEVGVVGANCLYPDGKYVESANKRLSVGREIVEFVCDSLQNISRKLPIVPGILNKARTRYYWDHQSSIESDVVYFSCMMFRKELIEKIGYFDERFFIWFADYDWCQRVLNLRLKVCWLSEAQAIHYERYSKDFIDNERVRYKTDGWLVHELQSADKYTLIRKHHSQWLLRVSVICAKLSLWRNRLKQLLVFALPKVFTL